VTTTPSPWRLGVELVRLSLVGGGVALLMYGTATTPIVGSAPQIGCGRAAVDAAGARVSVGRTAGEAPDAPDDDDSDTGGAAITVSSCAPADPSGSSPVAESHNPVELARHADAHALRGPPLDLGAATGAGTREQALSRAVNFSDDDPGDNDSDDDLGDQAQVAQHSHATKAVNDADGLRITLLGIDPSSFFKSDNHSLRAPPQ